MIYYYEYYEHFYFTDMKTEEIALRWQEPGAKLQTST